MGQWSDIVDDQCKALEVASFTGLEYTFNAVGAGAHAKFLREMARRLDIARDMQTADPPGRKCAHPRQGRTTQQEAGDG